MGEGVCEAKTILDRLARRGLPEKFNLEQKGLIV